MTMTTSTFLNSHDLVESFRHVRILCIGDIILDTYIEGEVSRISPESPVPVLQASHSHDVPGGAANVVSNVVSIGASCTLISVVGEDSCAHTLYDLLSSQPLVRLKLIPDPMRPTTRKTRFVTHGHHMLRVDDEVSTSINSVIEKRVIDEVTSQLPSHDIVVISDYGKGLLTELLTKEIIGLAIKAEKKIVVDPKTTDIHRFSGATIVTPNSKEAFEATGINPVDDFRAIASARKYRELSSAHAVLMTRSEKGMSLVDGSSISLHLPTVAREVFDVVGAGDTVLATLATVLATGGSIEEAARIANVAAGIVVGKSGTASVDVYELVHHLHHASTPDMAYELKCRYSLQGLIEFIEAKRRRGQTIGFTNGVFDLLHPGHVYLLEFARNQCDCLIVGVNSDSSVKQIKGPTRPINSENDRLAVLSAFSAVDAVIMFDELTPIELISAIRPDVLIKGSDYTIGTVVGADLVRSYGGKVVLADIIEGKSSTRAIEKARSSLLP
jgi:D-beta-D-heptose 7-phosphate kinase/D-beta-D-heptose 1-phosphate adenosyltransferase